MNSNGLNQGMSDIAARRAVLAGVAGGVIGVAAGVASIVLQSADDGAATILGISTVAAALFGLVCVALIARGHNRPTVILGLFGAVAWHMLSNPMLGIPGGLLLLLSAVFALTALEEAGADGGGRRVPGRP